MRGRGRGVSPGLGPRRRCSSCRSCSTELTSLSVAFLQFRCCISTYVTQQLVQLQYRVDQPACRLPAIQLLHQHMYDSAAGTCHQLKHSLALMHASSSKARQ